MGEDEVHLFYPVRFMGTRCKFLYKYTQFYVVLGERFHQAIIHFRILQTAAHSQNGVIPKHILGDVLSFWTRRISSDATLVPCVVSFYKPFEVQHIPTEIGVGQEGLYEVLQYSRINPWSLL